MSGAGKERTSNMEEDPRLAATPQENKSFCLPCSCDPEHSTLCHGLLQEGSGHVAQQGLTLSALLASRLPGWVPRAPHICHPLSCQTHCFQAPQALPPPSRTRHRPQGLPYTPTSFSNSLPCSLCGDEKRLY